MFYAFLKCLFSQAAKRQIPAQDNRTQEQKTLILLIIKSVDNIVKY